MNEMGSGLETLSQADVERLLASFGCGFEVNGRVPGQLRFKSLRSPGAEGIYFSVRGASLPREVRASVVLTDEAGKAGGDNAYIHVSDPQVCFYRLMNACFPAKPESGVHPTALVAESAVIEPSAYIGPYCVVGERAVVGSGSRLAPHVVINQDCSIGEGCVIESHTTIGATGVAWVWDPAGRERIIQPQIGGVRVGANVFLGSDVSIVRGSVNEVTEVGDGTVIAHGTKIGHGCRIGRQAHFANNVSLAGNVDVGDRVFFGSGSVVRPRVSLAAGVVVGAGAVVTRDYLEEDVTLAGVPAKILHSTNKNLSGVPRRLVK